MSVRPAAVPASAWEGYMAIEIAKEKEAKERAAIAAHYPPPRFKHDCQSCYYLGQHGDGILVPPVDLYFCRQMPGIPTVIARYSDGPSDYWGRRDFGLLGINPSLTVAVGRAREHGLLPPA